MARGTMDDRPHVMHLYSRLDVGGIEWILMRLLPRLNAGRYRTSVCLLKRPGELAERLRAEGVEVHFVPIKGRMRPTTLVTLSRFFRREKVSIVHAHSRVSMASATLAARLARVPVVLGTVHTLNSTAGRRRALQERLLDKWRDAVVTVSERVREQYCSATGTGRDKCITIYHGIDLADFSPVAGDEARHEIRTRLGLGPEGPVVITVGRLARYKAHEILIAAAPEVIAAVPGVRFLVVGGGERLDELEAMTAQAGVDGRFRFLGNRSDLPDLYCAADIFCLTSSYEGFSIAIVEALASGIPVVATDVGGNREAVQEGVSGFLVQEGDSRAVARRLIEVLADPTLRARMSAAARERAARFSLEQTARATEALYDRLLAARGPRHAGEDRRRQPLTRP